MPVQLIITMDENGQTSVNGPIDNKALAYGMLMVAHDAIKDFHEQKDRRIVPATLVPGTNSPRNN